MWGRGEGKKKDEKKVPPTTTDSPMVVYVERTAPVTWKGTKVSGNLPESPFRDVFGIAELEERVGSVAGGHDFLVKFHDQADTNKYLGRHKFSVAADPLRDGKPIGNEEETGGRGKKAVSSIQAEIERTKAESELDAAKAAREKKAKLLQEDDDDDDEETGIGEIEALRGEVTDQISQAIDGFKEVMLAKNQQDAQQQQHRELLEAIKAMGESRSQGPGEFATVMSSQMETLKSIVTAGSGSNAAMLTAMDNNRKESANAIANVLATMQSKSDGLMQMFLTQMNQHVDTQLKTFQQLSDTKGDNAQKSIDLMKETLSMGVALGMGRELDESPKTLTDVFAGFTDKVADIAGKLIEQRGGAGLTKETLKDIMGKVAKKAIVRTKAEMSKRLPNPQAGATTEPSVTPVTEANPAAGVEPAPSVAEPAPLAVEPNELQRASMNAAIREWIKDLDKRGELDSASWIQIGNCTLPVDMLQEFMGAQGDPGQWRAILQKYGDSDLVSQLITKVQSVMAQSEAQTEADVESAVAEQFAEQTPSQTPDSSLEAHVEAEVKAGSAKSAPAETQQTAPPKKEPPTKIEPPEKAGAKAASASKRPSGKRSVAKAAKKRAKAGKGSK